MTMVEQLQLALGLKKKRSLWKDPKAYAAGGLAAAGIGLVHPALRRVYRKPKKLFGGAVAARAKKHGIFTDLIDEHVYTTKESDWFNKLKQAEKKLGLSGMVSAKMLKRKFWAPILGTTASPGRASKFNVNPGPKRNSIGMRAAPEDATALENTSVLARQLEGVTDSNGNQVSIPSDRLSNVAKRAIRNNRTLRQQFVEEFGTDELLFKPQGAFRGTAEKYRKKPEGFEDILDRPITIDDIPSNFKDYTTSPFLNLQGVSKAEKFWRKLPGVRHMNRAWANDVLGSPKLPDVAEYRVIASGGNIIPGATTSRWNPLGTALPIPTKNTRLMEDELQHVVNQWKAKYKASPHTMYDPSEHVIGFDVVRDNKGAIRIIEANTTDGTGYPGHLDNPLYSRAVNSAVLGKVAPSEKILRGLHGTAVAGAGLGALSLGSQTKDQPLVNS